MKKVFFVDRTEALDALDKALELSPEALKKIRSTLMRLPFTQAVEISSPNALNAAEYIKDYCGSQKGCDGCCFYKLVDDGNRTCCIGCPENWDVPESFCL